LIAAGWTAASKTTFQIILISPVDLPAEMRILTPCERHTAGRETKPGIEIMTMLTIKNEFTGNEVSVDTSKPLTAKKIKAIRSKLHAADCTSGDDLGGRGKQDDADAYEALLMRAQRIVATGKDE
jgi:hypothetical protein